MGVLSSINFGGAYFTKPCGSGRKLWDHPQISLANRLSVAELGCSTQNSAVTVSFSSNLLLTKPELFRFRLVCQAKRSEGDISDDEVNLRVMGTCFLDLWDQLQNSIKNMELVRSMALKAKAGTALTDLEATFGKAALQNATFALSLVVKKFQVLYESLDADALEEAKNNLKDCRNNLDSFKDQLGKLEMVLMKAEGGFDVLLSEGPEYAKKAQMDLKKAFKSVFGSQIPKSTLGKTTLLNVKYSLRDMMDDDGSLIVDLVQEFVEANEAAENDSQTENQQELPRNLKTLNHLVVAAENELKHAQIVRSIIEAEIDDNSLVDSIRYDEVLAWEQQASKCLEDAREALKRLEDAYLSGF